MRERGGFSPFTFIIYIVVMKYFNFSLNYLRKVYLQNYLWRARDSCGCRKRLTSPRIGFIQNFNSRDSVRILIFFCDKSLSIMISIHCRHPRVFS